MRNLVFILCVLVCVSCNTQKKVTQKVKTDVPAVGSVKIGEQKIADWTFAKERTDKKNEYKIIATLKLAKDWHIFDFNPGGDGFLIAPDFTFTTEGVEVLKKEIIGEVIIYRFKGMEADARFYENEVRFEVLVRSNEEKISGSVYYQLCDHEKCLAPTDQMFILN